MQRGDNFFKYCCMSLKLTGGRLAIDKMAKAIYPHWVLGKEGAEAEHLYMASLDDEKRQIERDLATIEQQRSDLQKE